MLTYRLIRATSVAELESQVNQALANGWELMNTPLVVATPTAVVWYLREMYQITVTPAYELEAVKNLSFNEYQKIVDELKELGQEPIQFSRT